MLEKLTDIEWDDFECKESKDKLPDNVWDTVSSFSNTSGGWIVFGIKQDGKKFEIQGLNNGEKTESDFLNTLRGGQKFNMRLSAKPKKYRFDGKLVLAFFVPSSMVKPIYYNNPVVDGCALCGKKQVVTFSKRHGGFLCNEHRGGEEPLPVERLKKIRLIVKGGLEHYEVLKDLDYDFTDFSLLMDFFLENADLYSRSYDFYRTLI